MGLIRAKPICIGTKLEKRIFDGTALYGSIHNMATSQYGTKHHTTRRLNRTKFYELHVTRRLNETIHLPTRLGDDSLHFMTLRQNETRQTKQNNTWRQNEIHASKQHPTWRQNETVPFMTWRQNETSQKLTKLDMATIRYEIPRNKDYHNVKETKQKKQFQAEKEKYWKGQYSATC